jgi:hypothetical protein
VTPCARAASLCAAQNAAPPGHRRQQRRGHAVAGRHRHAARLPHGLPQRPPVRLRGRAATPHAPQRGRLASTLRAGSQVSAEQCRAAAAEPAASAAEQGCWISFSYTTATKPCGANVPPPLAAVCVQAGGLPWTGRARRLAVHRGRSECAGPHPRLAPDHHRGRSGGSSGARGSDPAMMTGHALLRRAVVLHLWLCWPRPDAAATRVQAAQEAAAESELASTLPPGAMTGGGAGGAGPSSAGAQQGGSTSGPIASQSAAALAATAPAALGPGGGPPAALTVTEAVGLPGGDPYGDPYGARAELRLLASMADQLFEVGRTGHDKLGDARGSSVVRPPVDALPGQALLAQPGRGPARQRPHVLGLAPCPSLRCLCRRARPTCPRRPWRRCCLRCRTSPTAPSRAWDCSRPRRRPRPSRPLPLPPPPRTAA